MLIGEAEIAFTVCMTENGTTHYTTPGVFTPNDPTILEIVKKRLVIRFGCFGVGNDSEFSVMVIDVHTLPIISFCKAGNMRKVVPAMPGISGYYTIKRKCTSVGMDEGFRQFLVREIF